MSLTKSGKPRASMITSGSPQTVNDQTLHIALSVSVPTGPQTPSVVVPATLPSGPQIPPIAVAASVPTRPQTPPVVVPVFVTTGPQTVPIGLQTPRASTPAMRFSSHRLSTSGSDSLFGGLLKEVSDLRKSVDIVNKKIDATNRRTTNLETLLTMAIANTNIIIEVLRRQSSDNTMTQLNPVMHSQTTAEETPSTPTTEGIPAEFRIDNSLRVLVQEYRNAGNLYTETVW